MRWRIVFLSASPDAAGRVAPGQVIAIIEWVGGPKDALETASRYIPSGTGMEREVRGILILPVPEP